MKKTHKNYVWPLAAVSLSLLTGCAGNSLGLMQSKPFMSPAAQAAADMPKEKDPAINTQDTYLALVRQMQGKSLWFASLAHLDALDKQWGASAESRLLRADALRKVGQLDASTALYRGLLGSTQDGAARYGLGRVAAEQGDYRSAAAQLEQARLSSPVDAQLLTDLGYVYLQARNLNAARMPLMQAAQLNPDDVQAAVNLSLYLMVNGQGKEAEAYMAQRKLDASTQLTVKEQAAKWLQGPAPVAVSQAAPESAIRGVVNGSAPLQVAASPTIVQSSKDSAQEPSKQTTQQAVAAGKAEAVAVSFDAPVLVKPVEAAVKVKEAPVLPVQRNTVVETPAPVSSNVWKYSDVSFDSARPSRPGGSVTAAAPAAPMVAVAPPTPSPFVAPASAPVQAAVAPAPSFLTDEARMSTTKVNAGVPLAKPAAPQIELPQALPAKPAAPASAARLMQAVYVPEPQAAANSGVRQIKSVQQSLAVQAVLPASVSRRGGLYYETPEPEEASKTSLQKQTPSKSVSSNWP